MLSAFIKSIRGSDVDAGLYWLARMVEAGEDPRLIARRLVILASEDVGMADPQGLVVADAAARAVEFVGHARGAAQPRARGRVPGQRARSRTRSTTALWARAMQDVRDQPAGAVPAHLRDAQLPWRGEARARRGVRVPARRARTDGCTSSTGPTTTPTRYWRPTGRGADVDRRAPASAGTRTSEEGRSERRASGRRSIGAQVCLVLLVVLVVMIVRLDRAAKELRARPRDFRAEADAALARAARRRSATPTSSSTGSTRSSSGAERVGDRVDAASALADRTFTSPVVKALAVGTGTRRAVQRLKRRQAGQAGTRQSTDGRPPDVQAGHLARRRVQPRRRHHRRRRPQGPQARRPLPARARSADRRHRHGWRGLRDQVAAAVDDGTRAARRDASARVAELRAAIRRRA